MAIGDKKKALMEGDATAAMVGADAAGTAAGLVATRLKYLPYTLDSGDLAVLERIWTEADNYGFFQGSATVNQGIAFFGFKKDTDASSHASTAFICRGNVGHRYLLAQRNSDTKAWIFYSLWPE